MNKILSSGLVIGAMMSLIGCGGGSGSDVGATSGGGTGSVATGTAFYIDSAVSGVNYKCGSTEGITGTDGAFTFEVGASCTFYLGDIKLRGVDAGLLVDGENVYETDVKIARILQSLDSDGDPSNGITIKSDTIKALSEHGITSLPTSEAEMDEMLAVIAANGGTEIGEAAAQEHVLHTLVVGKTLYQFCKDSEGNWIATLTFGADGNLVMVDGSETETVAYRINGNIVYTIEDGEEEAHPLLELTDAYIKFDDGDGETSTFYFTSEAAKASTAMDCGGDDESGAGAADILIGKTFYEADMFQGNLQGYTSAQYLETETIYTDYTNNGTPEDGGSAHIATTYEGNSVTSRLDNAYSTCTVERKENSIFMTCHNDTENWTGTLWDTVELAQENATD